MPPPAAVSVNGGLGVTSMINFNITYRAKLNTIVPNKPHNLYRVS